MLNKNKKTLTYALYLGSAALFSLANSAYATDSARLLWDTNGHYYQLFEGAPITWSNAKTACESISAHLATITSETENGFILSKFLAGRSDWYGIGGTSTDTYKWSWITGEAWGFQPFDGKDGYPKHNAGQDYVTISANHNQYGWSGYSGQWFNVYASDTLTGYLCEWSTQNYIDTTLVPDQNGNGVDEVASLFVNYKTGQHTVQIKDPSTDKLLTTMVFATSFIPPSGLVVLSDSNGNNAPEIGVIFTKFGYPSVQIKDVKTNATLRNINFMTPGYKPKSIGVGPDKDGNGADEIVVLGISKKTGAANAEIRDSLTGNATDNTAF